MNNVLITDEQRALLRTNGCEFLQNQAFDPTSVVKLFTPIALHHLQVEIGKVESLLALIHPENLRLLQANGLLCDPHRAWSVGEIRRFQHLVQVYKVNSLSKLARLVDQSTRESRVLDAGVY